MVLDEHSLDVTEIAIAGVHVIANHSIATAQVGITILLESVFSLRPKTIGLNDEILGAGWIDAHAR